MIDFETFCKQTSTVMHAILPPKQQYQRCYILVNFSSNLPKLLCLFLFLDFLNLHQKYLATVLYHGRNFKALDRNSLFGTEMILSICLFMIKCYGFDTHNTQKSQQISTFSQNASGYENSRMFDIRLHIFFVHTSI